MNKKIFFLIGLIFMLSSFASAVIDTNDYYQWLSFDVDMTDDSENTDATGDCTITVGGLNSHADCDGTEFINSNIDNELSGLDIITVSFWAKYTSSAQFSIGNDGDDRIELDFNLGGEDIIRGYVKNNNVAASRGTVTAPSTINDGNWHFYIWEFDTGVTPTITLYIDNSVQTLHTKANANQNFVTLDYTFYLTGLNAGGTPPKNPIDFDEFSIYNGAYTSQDRTDLYNGGSGFNPFSSVNNISSLEILTPINNDHLNDNPVLITYNITDVDDDLINCTIQLNGSNQTTTSNINTTTNNIQEYNLTTNESNKNITIVCFDGVEFVQNSTIFVVDRTNPDWTIRTINTDNSSIIDRSTIDSIYFNDSVEDTYLFSYNITAYYPNNSIWFSNQTINLNVTNFDYEFNKSINVSQPNGTYTINYYAEDDHTAKEISEYDYEIQQDGLIFNFENYYINIKSDNPQTINDLNTTKLIDRYTFDFNYKIPKNIRTYSLFSNKIIYYRGELYSYPVFVIGKNWVDFNIPDDIGTTYKIFKKSNYWYQIEITKTNPSTNDNIKSLGGLNVVNETYTFQIKENTAPTIINTTPTQNFSIDDGNFINFTTLATDFDNDSISYTYYFDGVLNFTGQNLTNFFVPFNSHGLHNMTVVASDGGKTDNFTWIINITHSNLHPLTQTLVRTPLTSWYSNIENTKFICGGIDQDNETQPINWTVEIEYRNNILWHSLITEFYQDNKWSSNISISSLEGEILDVRCRISDGDDFSDWFIVNNIVTIEEAYNPPGNITNINPSDTTRDYVTSVTCGLNEYGSIPSYLLRYDIDSYYNGTWNNLSNNFFNKAVFDMAKINYGDNVKFRCSVNDGVTISSFLESENVTRTHINNLFMFSRGNDEVINAYKPYYKGLMVDFFNEPNITITSAYVDCNGDSFWDYYWEYNETKNMTKEHFSCINSPGIIKHTIGIFINKTGINNLFCGKETNGVCKIERTYGVLIK